MNTEERDIDEEAERKHPKVWGVAYMIVGLAGLGFSAYALISSMGMVPLYGTVTAGALVGFISLIVFIYGYRVFNRDY